MRGAEGEGVQSEECSVEGVQSEGARLHVREGMQSMNTRVRVWVCRVRVYECAKQGRRVTVCRVRLCRESDGVIEWYGT